jgi:hypothetical protein
MNKLGHSAVASATTRVYVRFTTPQRITPDYLLQRCTSSPRGVLEHDVEVNIIAYRFLVEV